MYTYIYLYYIYTYLYLLYLYIFIYLHLFIYIIFIYVYIYLYYMYLYLYLFILYLYILYLYLLYLYLFIYIHTLFISYSFIFIYTYIYYIILLLFVLFCVWRPYFTLLFERLLQGGSQFSPPNMIVSVSTEKQSTCCLQCVSVYSRQGVLLGWFYRVQCKHRGAEILVIQTLFLGASGCILTSIYLTTKLPTVSRCATQWGSSTCLPRENVGSVCLSVEVNELCWLTTPCICTPIQL
jgi:hypothetical protein